MFTGIVEGLSRVESLSRTADSAELTLDLGALAEDVALGDSVSVNGACLTATRIDRARIAFDVSAETLSRTTLGDLSSGAQVNVERALRVGDRLGGHFVQGHVDAVGVLVEKETQPGQWTMSFRIPLGLAATLVEKGSVAVDGVSLTVASLIGDVFTVALIPHTIERTTLKGLERGARVNVEGDVIGKYVARLLGKTEAGSNITEAFLAEHGFTTR
jgi:riboflavin synthase